MFCEHKVHARFLCLFIHSCNENILVKICMGTVHCKMVAKGMKNVDFNCVRRIKEIANNNNNKYTQEGFSQCSTLRCSRSTELSARDEGKIHGFLFF